MEIFSALLALCVGNSPVTGEFPSPRPVTHSFDVFFDLRLDKRLSKQSWRRWFETLLFSLWRHSNAEMVPSSIGQWWQGMTRKHFPLRAHSMGILPSLVDSRHKGLVTLASYQIRKIAGSTCAGNAGNVFPTTDFKGNRGLAIRACITARASRTYAFIIWFNIHLNINY